MINKFEKQLEKWNGGVLRGAQAKLARCLQVSTATVALWATGKRRPSKGYATQMAQLFGLDSYDVMRLFSATTTYPDLPRTQGTRSLRDAQTPENTYSANNLKNTLAPSPDLSNSVSLPFLTGSPEKYPHFQEGDVAEWWMVPRRYARGAKYLFRAGQPAANELYFIRPEKELAEGKLMLFKTPLGYTVKKGVRQDGKINLYTPQGRPAGSFAAEQITVLGGVVCKIADAE